MLSTHPTAHNPRPRARKLTPPTPAPAGSGVVPEVAAQALDAVCETIEAARTLWAASGSLDALDALTVAAEQLQTAADAAIGEALTAHAGRIESVAGVAS